MEPLSRSSATGSSATCANTQQLRLCLAGRVNGDEAPASPIISHACSSESAVPLAHSATRELYPQIAS